METEKKEYIEENDRLNQLSMNILVHAGNARDCLVQSLESLEESKFEKAKEEIKEARKEVVVAHGLQTDTLQLEASGQQIRYSTLFCHAQDTLMTAQSEILIGEHLIKLFTKLDAKMGGL
ncbi:Oligo-beta-mannoside-specific phosphotransferase enzyme IIA component [Listeria grayi]|uniref:PTS system, Lactose/Cellobiose specific IIA subunit n=2 Tax=Listeria grayi TaxID=1641 RepID=D7UWE0_LISGR|nr:PTS lactose/cellobiose transporter subunit IIA [Listeria grayi]EFI84024.1 PTS system, Lactose/Cellobiose specific IIA subunit [Listeria grayi DSM 20601]EUJ30457.1 putative phosphotransferase system enzyme IIA [Listeria grayi FSL F6-1183]VEI31335.1 Oligo-beta-mannoside-specific phosphotransferase enzyme IIA component [Listeria grayi]